MKAKKLAIYAVDPGGSTGVAAGFFPLKRSTHQTLQACKHKESYTIDGDPLAQTRQLFRNWRTFYTAAVTTGIPHEDCWMVIEDFLLSPASPSGKDILLATKVAYMLLGYRYGAADEFDRNRAEPIHPIQVVWQPASIAMNYATDERLKRWGIWVRGRDHERAAYRHLACFINGQIT